MKKLATWYGLLKGKLDFAAIKKTTEDENNADVKSESKPKAEVKPKTVKNTAVKGDSKSKGKSVGTIRKMA
jgi:hypothetical protein